MTALRVDTRNLANASVLDFHGDLSADGETVLEHAYRESVERGTGNVIFNLEHAEYINTSGISVLIGIAMKAGKEGVALSLAGANAHYRKVFDLVRLSTFVSMFDDEAAALEGL